MTVRRIVAQYDDTCRVCGCRIRAGQTIRYGGRGAISHDECSPADRTDREGSRPVRCSPSATND